MATHDFTVRGRDTTNAVLDAFWTRCNDVYECFARVSSFVSRPRPGIPTGASRLSKTMKMCHVTDFILRRIMRASTTVGSALARATGGRASPRANSSGPLARASSTGAEIAKGDGFVVPEGCQLAVFASG